jgi:RHS repeat-associated protein
VRNTGTCTDTYSFAYSATGPVFGVALDRTSFLLASNQSVNVTASYSVGVPGSGVLGLSATGGIGGALDNRSFNVTANAPPPPSPGAPVVDASPTSFLKQDYGMCATACFAVTASRSTVPYFSLDAPRNVTLVYNGDRVNPRPFVHVNVSPDLSYGSWPTEYQLQVKVDGAFVTFVNGEQTLRFAYTGTAPVRIGAQFDASSYATGAYPMDILVSALHNGNTLITNALTTKLLVVNEINAPTARGWTVAGIQRLYPTADSSALITEGDGSAAYLPFTGVVYVTPVGEFSGLKLGTPSGGSGWTRSWPDSTKVVFDNTGRMIQVLDPFGNATTVMYDGSGRVSQVKDPLNIPFTLAYGTNGLSSIQESMGRVTNVTVDASRRLTAVTDPDGIGTGYGYDASLRLNSVIDRRSATTVFGYDAQSGKLGTVTAPAVPVYQRGTISPVTILAAWQKLGVPYVATSGAPFTAPRADTVKATVTEPGGAVSRFTVNGFGQPVLTLKPLGDTLGVTYTANGQPTIVRRSGYASTEADTTLYNTSGLPTYTRPAGLPATNIRYAAYGQADSTWGTDEPGVRRFIGLKGRLDSMRVGGTVLQRVFYNARGQVDSAKDGNNVRSVKNTRGGTNGNLSQSEYPGSRLVTYTYDSYGRPTSIARPGLATETPYWSVINRKDSVKNGFDAQAVKFGYDQVFMTSVTDPKGQVYGFGYNALGWLTARTDPAGGTDSVEYNVDGDATRRRNRRALAILSVYDSLHRISSGVGDLSFTWTYANHGRIVTASGGGVSTETAFLNVFGSPDSVKTVMAGQTFWRRYGYTQSGKLDSVDVSGAGITFLGRKYLYNATKGILTGIRLNGAATSFTPNNNLQVISSLFSGGDIQNRQYNTLHRLMQVSSTSAYTSWTQRDVGFDDADRVSQQLFGGGNTGELYDYDGLGRLKNRSSGYYDPLPPWCSDPDNGVGCFPRNTWVTTTTETFTYDPAGNRTDRGGTYLTGNRVTVFDGCNYTTDSDGNVISRTGGSCSRGTGTLTWHAEGLLATVITGGATTALKYDAAGRLVRKDLNGAPQSHFLWEGSHLLAELDGNGTVKRAEYSYYPGFDRLHALIIGSTLYYAHADAIGNVIALTDVSQNVKRSYAFDMWGTLVNGTDYLPFNAYDRARWKGALLLIPELNLYYMRSRWYEGGTGRFLSEDPLGIAGGMNPYAYAGNDPVNHGDPTGLLLLGDGVFHGGGGGLGFADWLFSQGVPCGGGTLCNIVGGGLSGASGISNVASNALASAGPSMASLLAVANAALAAGYEGLIYTSEQGVTPTVYELASIIYRESAGVMAGDLSAARLGMAHVIINRWSRGAVTGTAPASLTGRMAAAIRAGGRAGDAFLGSVVAAVASLNSPLDPTNGANRFNWQTDSGTYGHGGSVYGPFIQGAGGDIGTPGSQIWLHVWSSP